MKIILVLGVAIFSTFLILFTKICVPKSLERYKSYFETVVFVIYFLIPSYIFESIIFINSEPDIWQKILVRGIWLMYLLFISLVIKNKYCK